MSYALDLKGLKKVYATGVEALRGIDLTVEEGDFYALLGPNGAGKSTTIGIITSLVNKTAGQVKVFDYDIDNEDHWSPIVTITAGTPDTEPFRQHAWDNVRMKVTAGSNVEVYVSSGVSG